MVTHLQDVDFSHRWSSSDDDRLRQLYGNCSQTELCTAFPSRTWEAIKHRAWRLKVNRLEHQRITRIKGNPSKLLDQSVTSCYWIGFLLADGHFPHRNAIRLNVGIKDEQHLLTFARYIDHVGTIHRFPKGKKGGPNVLVCIQDALHVRKLCDRFDICQTKTTHPPSTDVLEALSDDQFLSLLIGFIDGDGHIYAYPYGGSNIVVKCHGSWLKMLSAFAARVNRLSNNNAPLARLNKLGYANLRISRQSSQRLLKQTIKRLNLPALVRKWNHVDENYMTQYERLNCLTPQVLTMLRAGASYGAITKVTGLKSWSIRELRKKHNIPLRRLPV
jgi:hypothetical protein